MINTVIICVAAIMSIMIVCLLLWRVHVSMNKDENLPYDFVKFTTFLQVFEKYKNHPNLEKRYQSSIFLTEGYQHIVWLHADIVKIENKCMIFYPLGYVRYIIWKRRFCNNIYRQKGLWNTES